MLRKLSLHNFKTFLNTDLVLTRRHLLIGRNNSGKTNVCSALKFLSLAASGTLEQATLQVPGGLRELTNFALAENEIAISCECRLPFDDDWCDFIYSIRILVPRLDPAGNVQGELRVMGESLRVTGGGLKNAVLLESDGREAHMYHEEELLQGNRREFKTLCPAGATMLSKLYELPTNRRAILFRKYAGWWTSFSLSPKAMRTGWTNQSGQSVGQAVLQPDGANLANVLFGLKNMNERAYRNIIERTQRLVEPDLKAINFIPGADQPAVPFLELAGRNAASWHGLSDGTIRVLALNYIFDLHGSRSGLACIEEPENGVYPGMLRKLWDVLDDCGANAQFIFTSHSPYFINLFDCERDSVTLLRRNKERTEVVAIPPAGDDPQRALLAEQYSLELLD